MKINVFCAITHRNIFLLNLGNTEMYFTQIGIYISKRGSDPGFLHLRNFFSLCALTDLREAPHGLTLFYTRGQLRVPSIFIYMSSLERIILTVEEGHLITNKGGFEGWHLECHPSFSQQRGEICLSSSTLFNFLFTTRICGCV